MAKRGMPEKYESTLPMRAHELALLGATDLQMCKIFGVSLRSWNNWKKRYPEFKEALRRGKDQADAHVAQALYHRAKGYKHIAFKIMQHEGRAFTKRYVERFPPDTTACIFWLKNRQPHLWRDAWRTEITGKDGGPVETREVSDAEVARRAAFLMAKVAVEKARDSSATELERKPE
jgi:hypothetical protein